MPVYEFMCPHCQQRMSLFIRTLAPATSGDVGCPNCGTTHLKRVISKVAAISGKIRQAGTPRTSTSESSRELADTMRKAAQKPGADYGSQFNEVLHRLEKGESSTSIERTLRKRAGQNPDQHH